MNQTIKNLIGAVIVIVLIIAGYQAFKKSGTSPSTPSQKATIKIGLSAPLTGEAASWGENALAGAELAVEEINKAGGINGRQIKLMAEDDKCDPTAGANAFNKLVNIDEVTAIAGPICSGVGGAALPIAQNKNIPTVIIAASNPQLTIGRDFVFRIYPSDAFQGKIGAEFIFQTLGKKKVAVIYVKNEWGQAIKGIFINKFKELGGEVVYEDSILQDATDLRTQLAKVKDSSADALYFPVYPTNAVAGLKQIKELGIKIPVIGGDALDGEEVIKSPGSEGLIYTVPKVNNPDVFKQKIKNLPGRAGLQVSLAAPLSYDAVKILAAVIEQNGTESKAIRNGLFGISYRAGISNSLIEFDENGDIKNAEYDIKSVKNGKSENISNK